MCRMFFMFTTHYYAIGLVLAALGAWLMVRRGTSVPFTALSLMLITYGMAIYQANFVTAVCMLAGALLIDLIRNDIDLKSAILKALRYVLYLGACMVMFLIGSKIALKVTGKQMETYENLDTMGRISIPQLITALSQCYKTFFKTPFKYVYSMNPNIIVRATFLICILLLAYTFVKVLMSSKDISIKLLICLIICILPVAVNLIIIMAISSGTMYSIMVYEIVFEFLIPLACLNAIGDGALPSKGKDISSLYLPLTQKISLHRLIDVISSLALICTVLTYIWFANGNYLALEYTNDHDNAYFTALMTQVKSLEGYREGMPVALVGKIDEYSIADTRHSMIGDSFNIGGKSDSNLGAYSYWNIMTRVIGFDPLILNSDEEEEYFGNHAEVKEMPSYPNDGSIRIIDDTVVIKFGEYEPAP